MSSTIHAAVIDLANRALNAEQKRALAVATALEIIAASVAHSTDPNQLIHAMGNLSAFADEIQKAVGSK